MTARPRRGHPDEVPVVDVALHALGAERALGHIKEGDVGVLHVVRVIFVCVNLERVGLEVLVVDCDSCHRTGCRGGGEHSSCDVVAGVEVLFVEDGENALVRFRYDWTSSRLRSHFKWLVRSFWHIPLGQLEQQGTTISC